MKSIYKILTMLAVILSVAACSEDFLDHTPSQSVASELAMSTVADANIALNGCYDQLQDANVFGRDYFVICDLATDNSRLRPENSGRFLNPYYWTITATDGYMSGFWIDAYEAINRINNILVRIDDLEGDASEVARIKGEAHGLRATVNLMLVNLFAQAYNEDPAGPGIPILTEPAGVDYEPARNTVAEVYAQILADLNVADDNLAYSSQTLYFSKGAAELLKSRVYLYMGDWANAKLEAESVINNGGYTLAEYVVNPNAPSEPVDFYIEAWGADNSESIFNIGYSGTDNNSTNSLGSMYMEEGYGDVIPTTDLMDLYSDNDMRNYWFCEGADYMYTNKYPGVEKIGTDNLPLARLSEAYLNAAEANYELADEALAITYLDAIAKRADAGALTSTETGTNLINKILLERRKEFPYEGHRFWDLKRLGEDIVRVDLTVPSAKALVAAGSNDFAYPIPQVEMEVNSNITQNPGY